MQTKRDPYLQTLTDEQLESEEKAVVSITAPMAKSREKLEAQLLNLYKIDNPDTHGCPKINEVEKIGRQIDMIDQKDKILMQILSPLIHERNGRKLGMFSQEVKA